jgi:prolyl oligopeptidase
MAPFLWRKLVSPMTQNIAPTPFLLVAPTGTKYLVIDMETGQKLDDHIKWVKFSGISWFKDGFYYSRYDTPEEGKELTSKNEFQKVYFHKVGTSSGSG